MWPATVSCIAWIALGVPWGAGPTLDRITVDVGHPSHAISPTLYGIFFEEVNNAGDGGLYAELIRNRGFEDSSQPDHWTPFGGAMATVVENGSGKLPHRYLRLQGPAGSGVANEGYWGIPVRAGERYRLSFDWALEHESWAAFEFALEDSHGVKLAQFGVPAREWSGLPPLLQVGKSDAHAKLVVRLREAGSVTLDNVSLFPVKTWKQRPNGLRSDLGAMLDGLRPSFVRFPGGCWVEGDTMATSMRWKDTIGPVARRRDQQCLWGYMSTNGLGFHEYLQMCEDLGAAPLFVINCGMSHREVVPLAELGDYVQDALDALEYANGSTASKWGALRAQNGHPKPFGLRFIEIGNENGGPAYRDRYILFAKAIRARYPEVKLIADVWGGYPKSAPVDMIDEHYYSSPQFFMDNADRYDAYDRKGPKVYVGEYAVTQGCGNGNLIGALGEAAFMTGLERNSDVVAMASYAPLFANVSAKRWNPDLINFDGTRAYGIPSYSVQQLFSRNRGDWVLPTKVQAAATTALRFAGGGIAVGTWLTQAEFKDVRVVVAGKEVFFSPDGKAFVPKMGSWSAVEGALRQTSREPGALAIGGDARWQEATVTLRARKTGGNEGFLVGFARRDDDNWFWWNVGGWGNTRHAIERCVAGAKAELGRSVPGRVETGVWVDLRVQYGPKRIRCWLNGKLIHDVVPSEPKPLFATSSRVGRDGDVIVKVVNVSSAARRVGLDLAGCPEGRLLGTSWTLSSAHPQDENTLELPTRVSPRKQTETWAGPSFERVFPAYSVTVLRIKARR